MVSVAAVVDVVRGDDCSGDGTDESVVVVAGRQHIGRLLRFGYAVQAR